MALCMTGNGRMMRCSVVKSDTRTETFIEARSISYLKDISKDNTLSAPNKRLIKALGATTANKAKDKSHMPSMDKDTLDL